MPISVAKIAANTASVTLPWAGDTVTVSYYPGRVTEKALTVLNAFTNMNEKSLASDFEAFNVMLANLVKGWDVFEDDAETIMFPIEAARFPDLPFGFRMGIVQAIMVDIRPEALAPQQMSS